MAHDFVMQLRQRGMLSDAGCVNMIELKEDDPLPDGAVEQRLPVDNREPNGPSKRYARFPHVATFTHWPGTPTQVVDDMLKNERASGSF